MLAISLRLPNVIQETLGDAAVESVLLKIMLA